MASHIVSVECSHVECAVIHTVFASLSVANRKACNNRFFFLLRIRFHLHNFAKCQQMNKSSTYMNTRAALFLADGFVLSLLLMQQMMMAFTVQSLSGCALFAIAIEIEMEDTTRISVSKIAYVTWTLSLTCIKSNIWNRYTIGMRKSESHATILALILDCNNTDQQRQREFSPEM